MASPDPEIKEGFSLPVWMKTKPHREFEPFASSPPAPEDAFFYIKYPKTDAIFGKTLEQEVPKVLQEPKILSAAANYREKDWSKHTKPCQEVLHGIATSGTTTKSKPVNPEDDTKGEVAECGNSVVKVAHQMITSRSGSGRGFTVASPSDSEAEPQYHYARRGSRSLPATPAHSPPSSPNSRRRKVGNRYFTSPFEPSEDASGRSWLTMALLGFKKDLASSTSTLAEEDALEARLHGATLVESVENLGPSPRAKEQNASSEVPFPAVAATSTAKPSQKYRPRPSELREMNFWSPTSM